MVVEEVELREPLTDAFPVRFIQVSSSGITWIMECGIACNESTMNKYLHSQIRSKQ
jgi:hypothetical protein